MLIANYSVDIADTEYKVALYPEKASVWVVKTQRSGDSYFQELKHGSGTFKKVLLALRRRAEPGSLAAEHLDQCADTKPGGAT